MTLLLVVVVWAVLIAAILASYKRGWDEGWDACQRQSRMVAEHRERWGGDA